MRSRIGVGVLIVVISACTGASSSSASEDLRAYLRERADAHAEQFDSVGRWKGASPRQAIADSLLASLLRNRTAAGDSAVAFLLFVYTGEHSGEEVVCEAVRRGPVIAPIIEAYAERLPTPLGEPLPISIEGSGVLAPQALELLAKKSNCSDEGSAHDS